MPLLSCIGIVCKLRHGGMAQVSGVSGGHSLQIEQHVADFGQGD